MERQIIEFAFVVCHRRVGVAVELNDRVNEVPHLFIGCMEDVSPILMYVDALYVFAIDIATEMWSLIYHQTSFTLLMSQMGECGTEESGANYKIIIFLHTSAN